MSGRKSVAVLSAQARGHAYGRQAVWEAVRELRKFTLAEVAEASGENEGTVRSYVKNLVAGGYLNRSAPNGPFVAVRYELARDDGVEAPRLRRDGGPVLQGLAREQMWRTMKMLRSFTALDLAVAASTESVPVAEDDAKNYVRHLARAGYLAELRPGSPGRPGLHRLAVDTGPRPPMVTRAKVVFDPNLNRLVWHEEVDA